MDKTPIIYAYLIYKIKKNNRSNIISKSDLNKYLNRTYENIPFEVKKKIINELIEMKIIKIVSFNSCVILDDKCVECFN